MITQEDLKDYLRKIDALKDGVSSYAYKEDYILNNGNKEKWVIVAVNDYDLYMKDQSFRNIINEVRSKCQDKLFSVYRPLNSKVKKELQDKIIMP